MSAPRHGGDLEAALAAAGVADAAGWHDLSTGINPFPYPVPELDHAAWARLPEAGALAGLETAARACYGVPPDAGLAAGPGTEVLIRLIPALFAARRVDIVGPTYSSHAQAWRLAAHDVREVPAAGPDGGDIVVLANPNNPDGRIVAHDALEELAGKLTANGGWLVVDEAFADAVPGASAVALAARANVIVLRSFGKFFGLAGLRLGFAIAPRAMVARIAERLGAWPVSGPALAIGVAALADKAWHKRTRARLAQTMRHMDAALRQAGIPAAGGTPLFRFIDDARAPGLNGVLWANRICARRFEANRRWLRLGLPGADGMAALSRALGAFAGNAP